MSNRTWAEAEDATLQALSKIGDHIERDALKKSYKQVQKDMRAGRTGKYFTLKDKRYRGLG